MVDVSNKALSVLLIVAVVVSIGGTMMTLSRLNTVPNAGPVGFANYNGGTAETNFTINSSLSIYFVNPVIPFGTGTVNDSGSGYCAMGTNNTPPVGPDCIGFNSTVNASNLTIENNGNIRANVTINFTGNATQFIGGSVVTPEFKYLVYSNESGSCATIGNGSTFRNVSATDTSGGSRICTNLNFTDVSDSLGIAIWVKIPKDAAPGRHNVTITAVACDDGSC